MKKKVKSAGSSENEHSPKTAKTIKNQDEENKSKDVPSPPIFEKPVFKTIYTIAMFSFFIVGFLLLLLSREAGIDILFIIGVLLIGLGIVLLTQRSTYKQTAPVNLTSEEKEEDRLSLRHRK